MASATITSIDDALGKWEFGYGYRWVFLLRNLKTFVLSARKIRNDYSLKLFLARISTVISNGPFDRFQQDHLSLEEGVEKWYFALLSNTQKATSLSTGEVLEIISSILENILHFGMTKHKNVAEEMEPLTEQLEFLGSLIRFLTQRGVEADKKLLAHSEIVVLDVAYFIYGYTLTGTRLQTSTLVQKIKPINPQVYETYTQALTSLKLLRRSLSEDMDMDDEAFVAAMKDFLDSLISSLWGILLLDTCVVFMKDQLKELYEGLRSLRTILKQQQNKLGMKIKGDIGDVLCDAGVIICSSYQKDIKVDLGFQDLLQTVKHNLSEVNEKDAQIPKYSFRRSNGLDSLDLLLEQLKGLRCVEAEPIAKSHVQAIQELGFLRSFLGEIMELRNEQEELQALFDGVFVVANRMESLIDGQVVGDLPHSFSESFESVTKDIRNMKAYVLKTFYDKRREIEINEVTSSYHHIPSQSTPSITNEVVGFDVEAKSTMERLTRGLKRLQIIAIVGMAGSGKTTLATKVYNDPSVMLHFPVRAWFAISQTLDRKKVLLGLLNQIKQRSSSSTSEEDLENELRRCLKGRKYLIFLDDIWDIEAWNRLTMNGLLFPDDNVGSRILLTSRRHEVFPANMLDQEPGFLRQLDEEESVELLQKKLFPRSCWPPALRDIGLQIAKRCKGLPLTIVIAAGILATKEQGAWKEILNDLSSGHVSVVELCKNTLELSYKILPNDLRSCFLYFGAFPEDQEVSIIELIRLWIAEGFVQKTEMKSLKDAAEDCLKDLIGRSLIMVAKRRSDGGVKACRIHDLLHDFCVEKAKNEHFFHFVKGADELLAFNEPCNLRRLCIESKAEDLKSSKLFCPSAQTLYYRCSPDVSVLHNDSLNISFLIPAFNLLKVLDLQEIYLLDGFPSDIELLVQLAFLAIWGDIKDIPLSIAHLSNLETLIVNSDEEVYLPDSLWDLRKLQCLRFRISIGCYLPRENLDSSSILNELDELCGVIIPLGSMERLLRKFPNVRRLKCRVFTEEEEEEHEEGEVEEEEEEEEGEEEHEEGEGEEEEEGGEGEEEHEEGEGEEEEEGRENVVNIVFPDFLNQLESLHLGWRGYFDLRMPDLSFPENLKKLTLDRIYLSGRSISIIGKLPSLEVLKFEGVNFEGERLEMEEGEFKKVRILKFDACAGLCRWKAGEDQFDCLEKLALHYIDSLEEMPEYCLESIATLEIIEISYCSPKVLYMVEQIEEEQVNSGNSSLKVIGKEKCFDADYGGYF